MIGLDHYSASVHYLIQPVILAYIVSGLSEATVIESTAAKVPTIEKHKPNYNNDCCVAETSLTSIQTYVLCDLL